MLLSHFSLLMDIVCSTIQDFTTPFQDDTAIGALSWEEHLDNTESFLTKIKDSGMTCNAIKSQVAQDYVEFLGHKVGQGYRTPAEVKIAAVQNFQTPKTKKRCKIIFRACRLLSKVHPAILRALLVPDCFTKEN